MRGEGFIWTEKAGRQQQKRIRIDRIGLPGRLSGHDEVALRRRAFDDCPDGLRLSSDRGIERELDGPPLRCVSHLQAPGDDVDRRAQTSGAGDRPAGRQAVDRDLFRSDRRATKEDREARRARFLQRRRDRRLLGRGGERQGQRGQHRADRMGRRHAFSIAS